MAKKKRFRKITVFCAVEGVREALFLQHLKEVFSDLDHISFPDNPVRGGSGDHILSFAIKNCHYDRSFAWIDEDLDLNTESRKKLAECWQLDDKQTAALLLHPLKHIQKDFNSKNKKPVLIVSQPICTESLILRALGKKPKYEILDTDPKKRKIQIKHLKNQLDGVFGSKSEAEYYREHLTKEILEDRRKIIPELDLLIKMISK